MRAARERVGLTQEQVAERMNVSIHTFRKWDQDRNRPSRPERMQLLAAILGTRVGVIWPATDDPLVAEALRLEQERGAAPYCESTQRRQLAGASPTEADEPGEIRVRRLEQVPVGSSGRVERAAGSAPAPQSGPGARRPTGELGGLPPWPDDERDDDLLTDQRPAALDTRELEGPELEVERSHGPAQQRSEAGGAVTMLAARPSAGWRLRRVLAAVGAAAVIGGAGMVAASALGERAADAGPSTTEVAAELVAQRERVEARARDVATMRAAADRGDYDAAIGQARQLDDPAAVSGYRESAARVLVGRAEKAAGRGDLSLARSRLRAAKRRYGTAPGAKAVQARVRRIERQRKERAERERAAARRAAAALAARQRAAADAARASEPPVSTAPAPLTSSVPQSSAPAPSSSSSEGSGSGGGSGKKKDPEEAVDPGLF